MEGLNVFQSQPMKIVKVLLGVAACLALQSCVHALEVVQSNSRTVTLEYNSVLTDYKTVVKTADQEAKKYGKEAVVRGVINERRKTQWGSIDTIVFDLVNPAP